MCPFLLGVCGLLTSLSSVSCMLWVRPQRYCCTEQQFWHSIRSVNTGLSSLASETLLASSQSLNETEVRQGDLSEGYVNGRSNHLVAACCPFSVFPSCCQFESVRCCVDDFLVHDLSVFHCDVDYIRFGHAVFGIFFSGACFDLSGQDSILFNLTCGSVNILAVALGLVIGSDCMDGGIALRCLNRTTCCTATASSGRRQVFFMEWGCRKVDARCFWKQLIL